MDKSSMFDEHSALVYAHGKLKDKDSKIRNLEIKIAELQKDLECEMIHSNHVSELNIELKEQVARLKDRLKVHPHPSAIQTLLREYRNLEEQNQMYRRVVIGILDTVEVTDENKGDIEELRRMYERIA